MSGRSDVVRQDVALVRPLTTAERVALAAEEGRRWRELLAALPDEQWQRPSGCTGWSVADLVRHLLGQADAVASPVAAARQARAGKRLAAGRALVDGITEHQVRSTAALPVPELRRRLSARLDQAARARGRWPLTSQRLGMRIEVPTPAGVVRERWTLAYMAQVYTRDLWMHRVDVTTALGLPMELTAEHDRRLLEDVVADWAHRHGGPFTLHLTGPAGGRWSAGADGPVVERDAVDFARGLFGRADPPPYGVVVPF